MFIHGLFSNKTAFSRNVARHWARAILFLTGVKLNVAGWENIKNGNNYLFVSNHQSTFDIFVLMSVLNIPFSFISKSFYFKVPIIGNAMRRVGHIPLVRENIRSGIVALKLAAQKLKEGASVIIFPEGTRSEDGKILPFKPGVIKITELTGRNTEILPITLIGTLDIQKKNELALHAGEVKVILGKPILVTIKQTRQEKEIIAYNLEKTVRNTYNRNLTTTAA